LNGASTKRAVCHEGTVMNIIFLNPWFLLLLVGLPVLWFMARHPRDKTQIVIRGLLLTLVIMALAKPIIFNKSSDKYHILLVDLSASLSLGQRDKLLQTHDSLIAQMDANDSYRTIVIGNSADDDSSGKLSDAIYLTSHSSSSISAALKEAVENIPDGIQASVTLMSDGKATDRQWSGAMQTIQDREIPIHTISLDQTNDDLYLSRLISNDKMREGQTAKLLVDVYGSGNGLKVELYADDMLWATSQVFDSDGYAKVALDVEPKRDGYINVEARLIVPSDTLDTNPDNNRITNLLAVLPPLQLLYLGERQLQGAEKLQTLLGTGFKVSEAEGRLLDETFPLDSYDLIVIDDRPASSLPNAFQIHLDKAVRENGLGLFYTGGRKAFGEGGYKNTPVEKLLPVKFQQNIEKKDPSVSLAIVMDTSGSMQGKPLELAKHVAKLAIGHLKPHDMVGVVEFYGNKQWAAPMQSAKNKTELERAINRMQADGSTVLYPAVEEAYYGLKNMKTRFKHLLILIDGDLGGDDYEPIVRRMAKDGITVSTVLLGQSIHHQEMFDVASWGRGRFYMIGDRFSLVDLTFKREQKSEKPSYHTGKFGVQNQTGSGWLGDATSIPDITGYVETTLKPGSEVLLAEAKKNHPVLASWRIGLGRVTSLMSEPIGNGTSNWHDWPSYGAMLARVMSRTAMDIGSFDFNITRSGHKVMVSAQRTSKDSNTTPIAWLLDETEEEKELTFIRRSPDLFQASFIVAPDVAVQVEASSIPMGQSVVYNNHKIVELNNLEIIRSFLS